MATNLDGTFFCAVAAGRHWRRQANEKTTTKGEILDGFQKGSFVATGSVMSKVVGRPQMQAPYEAAKAAVVHLCKFWSQLYSINTEPRAYGWRACIGKSLAVEWVDFARVNSVSPGYTATEVMQNVPDNIQDVWKGMTAMK